MSYENINNRWPPQPNDNIQLVNGAPAAGKEAAMQSSASAAWYNVKHWSKLTIGLVAAGIVAILIIIIVVPVEETKNDKYPNYSALNYTLNNTFSGTDFFDNFDYFTGYDPTAGFVHYMLADQAEPYNLTYASSTRAVVRVDNTQDDQTTGRYSVRLTSKSAWDTGLFLFDIYHTPYGCTLWPAIWTTSADLAIWPEAGEIDIMEAVNNATTGAQMTLHTTDDCKMDVKRKETGTVLDTNCWNGTDDNSGCGVRGDTSTYGSAFNANGGGIMAMELRTAGIRVWQFVRDAIPTDITNKTPDPSTWGEALADFPSTNCDISQHFYNQSIVIDIDICGDWAGAATVYSGQDSCPGTSCTAYAAQNKAAYDEAYFEFGSISIYSAK